jgi:excisionase family DNA binding protein
VKLLTVRELAERLAVPERTVYRLAGEGVPGAYRIRRSWRFDADRVLAALEAPHADSREGKR